MQLQHILNPCSGVDIKQVYTQALEAKYSLVLGQLMQLCCQQPMRSMMTTFTHAPDVKTMTKLAADLKH